MKAVADSGSALPARVDKPDFAEALAADTDGTFTADVNTYLDEWLVKIKGHQDAGLSSEEFAALSRLSQSIQVAKQFLDCFIKLQKLPSSR